MSNIQPFLFPRKFTARIYSKASRAAVSKKRF
jgi:hypothetical protein